MRLFYFSLTLPLLLLLLGNTYLPPGIEPIIISEDSKHITIEADGENVLVTGSNNQIEILGNVVNLRITGNYNDVDIDTIKSIEITGHYNFVAWRYGPDAHKEPTVVDKGGYNNVGKRYTID